MRETGFIRSVDQAVQHFLGTVLVHLDHTPARRTADREAVASG